MDPGVRAKMGVKGVNLHKRRRGYSVVLFFRFVLVFMAGRVN